MRNRKNELNPKSDLKLVADKIKAIVLNVKKLQNGKRNELQLQ